MHKSKSEETLQNMAIGGVFTVDQTLLALSVT